MLTQVLHSSNERKRNFHDYEAQKKLLKAFNAMRENFRCECKPTCNDIMQSYGPNRISSDREKDDIGYYEELQKKQICY